MSPESQKSTTATELGTSLAAAVLAAAKGNSHTATTAAAVLWPDKEGQWLAALPALKKLMPAIISVNFYGGSKISYCRWNLKL